MTNRAPYVDDTFYHFSDEGEEAILARAFDFWEQLEGGSTCGPLCQITMQPIGRRRRWRNVLEQVQFTSQLRQLTVPLAGENIGLALTEALHNAIQAELQQQQQPAHHFVNFALTAHSFTQAYKTAEFNVGEFLQRTA